MPLKMSYEAAKRRAETYTKIVEELPEMRRDTVDLVNKAVGEKRGECTLDDSSPARCAACPGDVSIAHSIYAYPDSRNWSLIRIEKKRSPTPTSQVTPRP